MISNQVLYPLRNILLLFVPVFFCPTLRHPVPFLLICHYVFTPHVSDVSGAIVLALSLCLCLCVRPSFSLSWLNRRTCKLEFWHGWKDIYGMVSRSSSWVKVIGQRSRGQSAQCCVPLTSESCVYGPAKEETQ